jgi:hypothetical protein
MHVIKYIPSIKMPFPNPAASIPYTKRQRDYSVDPLAHEVSVGGTGSLQSYYEHGVESEPPLKRHIELPHPNKGKAPVFGWLDVMRGDASAPNQDIWEGTGLDTNIVLPQLDNAAIDFQLILGKYRGYRLSWDSEYRVAQETIQEKITAQDIGETWVPDFSFENSTINDHGAQARHGMHYIDPTVTQQTATFASRFRVGDETMMHARHAGLERADNTAINTKAQDLGDENVYHNPLTIDPNVPTVIPIEPDTVRINEELVRPEDVAIAMGGNETQTNTVQDSAPVNTGIITGYGIAAGSGITINGGPTGGATGSAVN